MTVSSRWEANLETEDSTKSGTKETKESIKNERAVVKEMICSCPRSVQTLVGTRHTLSTQNPYALPRPSTYSDVGDVICGHPQLARGASGGSGVRAKI